MKILAGLVMMGVLMILGVCFLLSFFNVFVKGA